MDVPLLMIKEISSLFLAGWGSHILMCSSSKGSGPNLAKFGKDIGEKSSNRIAS